MTDTTTGTSGTTTGTELHVSSTDLRAGDAYASGDAPASWNSGTYWRLLSVSDTTDGRSTTFDELFPEGMVAPPHVHDDAEEAFFVLEGDLTSTLGDDDQEISALGTSALEVWQQIVAGRPDVPWEQQHHDVAKW